MLATARNGEWDDVTADKPCEACGHNSWCARKNGGDAIRCMRNAEAPAGMRLVKESRDGGRVFAPIDSTFAPTMAPAPPVSTNKAKPPQLTLVYTTVLAALSLTTKHRQDLERRGLDAAEIHRRCYRSLGTHRHAIIRAVEGMDVSGVPGFYIENGKLRFGGPAGLLIPVRDSDHRIVGLLVRVDEPKDGNKYLWVSSKKRGGAGSGAPLHFPVRNGEGPLTAVRVTEGALKADIATAKSGMLTLGVAGTKAWQDLCGTLKAIGIKTVRLAFDQDAARNHHVATDVQKLYRALVGHGFAIELEVWDGDAAKGIDDALQAGESIMVLTGAAVANSIEATVRQAAEAVPAKVPEAAISDTVSSIGDTGESIPLGSRDPQTKKLVLSPKRTKPTADAFVLDRYQHADGRTLVSYANTLHAWDGARYVEVEDAALKNELQPWLHEALRYQVNRKGELELVPFESNPSTVKAALESIAAAVYIPSTITPPAWLRGPETYPAAEVMACRSWLFHLATMERSRPTPRFFTISALDFDPDPRAPKPTRWLAFLKQLLGDDTEAIELLQEWFGYCLTCDTSLQKMLLLVGPRRSGKGTIGRVLRRLIGYFNVCSPTTSSLAGDFGLQELIGKSVAIVSDARFSGDRISTVVERLLNISGEDAISISRKYLPSVTMKLPTRFMFMSNELPRFNDSSNALSGRFVIVRLTESFYGREDHQLDAKLAEELPGILNWAIEGWKRLKQRGRFVMPSSVADAVRDIEDLASPVSAFIRDNCQVGAGQRVYVDDLYGSWRSWCETEGRQAAGTKQSFGRDLAAAIAGIKRRRSSDQTAFYEGVGLRGRAPPLT